VETFVPVLIRVIVRFSYHGRLLGSLIMKVRVILHQGSAHPLAIDLQKWFKLNDDDLQEQVDIMYKLLSFGMYHGGGGASPEWTLEVVEDRS
jgi:hypothetical protein